MLRNCSWMRMDDVHPSQRCTALFGGRLFPRSVSFSHVRFFRGLRKCLNQATFCSAVMCKARDYIRLVLLHPFWLRRTWSHLQYLSEAFVFTDSYSLVHKMCSYFDFWSGGNICPHPNVVFSKVHLNRKRLQKNTEPTWILAPELPVLIWLRQMYML